MLSAGQIEEIADLTQGQNEAQIKYFIGECLLAQGTINRDHKMRSRSFDPVLLEEIYQKVKRLQKPIDRRMR